MFLIEYYKIILLTIILILNFIYSMNCMIDRINPASVYSLGFLVASILSIYYRDEWQMEDFQTDTFILIIVGVLSYTLTCCFVSKIAPVKVKYLLNNRYYYNNGFILYILIYEIIYTVVYYKIVLGGVSLSGLSDTMLEFRTLNEGYPPIIQRMDLFNTIFSYYIGYLFALNLAIGYKKQGNRIITITCILCILSSLLTGAKGFAIYQIIFIMLVWSIIKIKNKSYTIKILSIKKIIKCIIWSACLIFLFSLIADIQGRGSDLGALYYFAIYCGAQFKNLDILMESNCTENTLWGEYSFHLIDDIETLKSFNVHNVINDYPLGNLSTALSYYYQDFKLIGTGIIVSCISLFMYFLYKKALQTNELNSKAFSIWIFLFAYIGRGLVLSFFTETFFLMWFSIYQIRIIIIILFFAIIVEKLCVKKIIQN